MTYEREELDTDRNVADFGVDVPAWIESGITLGQLDSIAEGGCASGAYMPAVTYYDARQTMGEHGDDVLEYIADALGEVPPVPDEHRDSWDSMACHFLSMAVELWASGAAEECRDTFEAEQDEAEFLAAEEAEAQEAAADVAPDAPSERIGSAPFLSPAEPRRRFGS